MQKPYMRLQEAVTSSNIYIEVPTYENGQWDLTTFYSREEFRDFVLKLFKEPGEYEFDESSKIFNTEAKKFQQNGYYCAAPVKTKDYIVTGKQIGRAHV